MKKITIQLSEESIKAAIKELDKYKKELSKKATILVQKLVDAGVEIAKQEDVDSARLIAANCDSLTG